MIVLRVGSAELRVLLILFERRSNGVVNGYFRFAVAERQAGAELVLGPLAFGVERDGGEKRFTVTAGQGQARRRRGFPLVRGSSSFVLGKSVLNNNASQCQRE